MATANLSTAQQNTERQTSTTPVGESQSLAMGDAAHLLHRSNEGTIQPPTTDVPTPTVEESCSRPLEQKRVPSGEQDPSSRGEALPCHPGKRVKYALPSLPECTKKQIEAMRLYYTSEFNLKRTGECLSQGTFAKLRERVLCKRYDSRFVLLVIIVLFIQAFWVLLLGKAWNHVLLSTTTKASWRNTTIT